MKAVTSIKKYVLMSEFDQKARDWDKFTSVMVLFMMAQMMFTPDLIRIH
jgi:hypothetical protein